MLRPLGAAALALMWAVATVLVLFADPSWSVFGIVGSLVLAFVVTFGSFSLLRLLLTRPARRPYEDRPGVDVRRTWGFGPFDPDVQPRALWGPRVWRWRRASSEGDPKAR